MSLHLGEKSMIKQAMDAVPVDSISLVVKSVDVLMIREIMKFIAEELVHDECY
jgi:hypothetical protein